jgi:hypothetical protein
MLLQKLRNSRLKSRIRGDFGCFFLKLLSRETISFAQGTRNLKESSM